jgi:hypothetical protein
MNSYKTRLGRLMLGCALLFFAAACSDGELRQCQDGLAAVERRLDQIQAENRTLSEENSRLQSDYETFHTFCESLRAEKEELARWSRELAGIYGPSVWYMGPYEKPLPRNRFQTATVEDLMSELNRLLRQDHLPVVILNRVADRTAYVTISDDAHLTQRMGSAGATAYLNAIVFTLSSLDSIRCVDFDFEEGDHAAPGRMCR